MENPCPFYTFGYVILLCFLLAVRPMQAQVAVNTDGSPAAPSAMLDVTSTMRGMLIPRMTTAERTAIASPATSLLVFDTGTNAFWFYNGTGWEQLVSASLLPGPSVITPPLISASTHDYNPTGFADATVVRVSGNNGLQMITGFAAGDDGEEKTIINVGNYTLYLAPEHSGSAAANRIASREEVMIPPGATCRIMYDAVTARWRPTDVPCPNYMHLPRSLHYDRSAAKVPEGVADDLQISTYGSLSQGVAVPTSASPFTAWSWNTSNSTGGGAGLFYPKQSEEMAYAGSAHMVAKMHMKTPATLSDAGNSYYYFLRIADSPSSGFWNQNNSVGLRYWHNSASGNNWECYSRVSGTDTVIDTGIPFEVNTEYELMVTLNKSNTEATYFINGVVVGRITTNLPALTSMGPSAQLEKLSGSSARVMLVYRFMGAAIEP